MWDITNPLTPQELNTVFSGGRLQFNDNSTCLNEYIVFEGSDFPSPDFVEQVANQNLKALRPRDGIIITHNDFRNQAQELADFHESHDGLVVDVIDVEAIYNEFSSGKKDVTAIRDAIRYYYVQNNSLSYVLLFGDCSYDYRDFREAGGDFIPVYESRNSVHPIFSYSSDDYYGFLEDGEGEWIETGSGFHTLDVGIGRLPVNTVEQAQDIVNKIIRYSTSSQVLGDWKNRVTYVVDDGDDNLHVNQARTIGWFF